MAEVKWADLFCDEARTAGLDCRIVNRVNGWPETLLVQGHRCFSKSMKYHKATGIYFQGVDPKKLNESGDFVVLCGGEGDRLRDVFVLPWEAFFRTLSRGEPINTYRPPREYWQYKLTVKDLGLSWLLSVQGGERPRLDVTKWRFHVPGAIRFLRQARRVADGTG